MLFKLLIQKTFHLIQLFLNFVNQLPYFLKKVPRALMKLGKIKLFLVACYMTLHPALAVCRSICRSVHWSIHPSYLIFLAFMGFLAMLLLPKCSTDFRYGPCPPARDWGSRISSLVDPLHAIL